MSTNASLNQTAMPLHEDMLLTYYRVFVYGFYPLTLTFGLAANIFIMLTFYTMGLTDGVTVSLFIRAIFDFSYLLISFEITIFLIIDQSLDIVPGMFKLMDIAYLSFWYSLVFLDTSMLMTAYMAVVRACCVAIPLRFKAIFTRSTTVNTSFALFFTIVAFRLPMLTSQYLTRQNNARTNQTLLTLYFTQGRPAALVVNDIINRNIFTWAANILTLSSLAILTATIMSSARFRQAHVVSRAREMHTVSRAKKTTTKNLGPKSPDHQHIDPTSWSQTTDTASEATSNTRVPILAVTISHNSYHLPQQLPSLPAVTISPRLTSRDLQLVKVVALVSAIFIATNFPASISAMVRRFVPEYNTNGLYRELFEALGTIFSLLGYLNASVNILVYYNFNSRFYSAASNLLIRRTVRGN